MNQERVLRILQAPHLSEKALAVGLQYVFRVIKDANKKEVKVAVEQLFNVQVNKVRIVNVKSKPARFGQRLGRHKGWKKAYVKLAEGSMIELPEG